MKRTVRCCVVVNCLLLGLIPISLASDARNVWIVDQAIPNLARFNIKGQMVSSDLSEYIKFKCDNEGVRRSCEIDQSNLNIWDFSALLNPTSEESIHSYATGVLLYGAAGIAGAAMLVMLTVLYVFVRIGYRIARTYSSGMNKKRSTSLYPFRLRFMWVIVFLGGTAAIVFTLVIISYTFGASQTLTGVSDVPDSPFGVASIAYRFSLALQPAFIGIVSMVVLPTLRNFNDTLCSAVSWDGIIIDLVSLNNTLEHLPNFGLMSNSLTSISDTTESINNDIILIFGDNNAYNEQEVVVQELADMLIADLMGLQDALDALSPTVTAGQSATAVLSADYVTFFGADGPGSYTSSDQDGDVDSAQYDIERTVRSDTAGEGIPTSATLTDAATGVSDSLTTLIATTLDEDVAGITALADKLRSIYLSIVQLPDFDATADTLEGINTQLAAMLSADAVLDDLDSFLTAVQIDLDDIPDTDAIATNAETFFVEAHKLSMETTQSHINRMDASVNEISDQIDTVIDEIDKLSSSISSILPPLYDLVVVQPANFNRTIYKVPDTTDFYNRVKEAVETAADEAEEVVPNLRDLNDALRNKLDLVDFTTKLTSADINLQDSIQNLDEPGMLAAIAAGSIDTTFDPASSQTQLGTLRTVMTNAEVPSAVITAFRNLQDICSSLESQLKRVAVKVNDVGSDGVAATEDGDYYLLAQGVCSDDTTVYCAADSDCSSGTCTNHGDYRCTPSTTGTDPVTTCTADTDCSGITDSYCLADSTRASDLQSSLVDLANVANTEFNQESVATNFGTLRTSAAAFDVDQMDSDLDAIQTDITAADTAIFVDNLYDFLDLLDDNDDSLLGMFKSLDTTQDAIVAVDTSKMSKRLDRLQEFIDKGGDKLSDYIALTRDLRDYTYSRSGLSRRFDELAKGRLAHIMENSGFGPALMAVGYTAENTVNDVREIILNNSFHMEHVELTNFMREPAMYLDRATGNPNTGFFDLYTVGSLYYFMQLSNATADMMVHARDPIAYAIMTDRGGNAYPDNKICVTRACFENQQTELEENGGKYIAVLLIPLFLVAILAVVNITCAMRPFYTCGRGAFPKILLCWIIVITPLYLIGSGIVLVFFIAMSDGCTSGPKIAANYIQAYGDSLCVKLSGNGTLSACHITGNDFNVTVNLNRMSDVILGLDTCSGNNEDDPFFLPLNAFAGQLRDRSVSNARRRIYSRRFRNFRSPVKTLVLDAVDGSAQVTHDFVQDMGDDVLTCENMQAILDYFTTPVCYSVVGPAAWMVVTIYLCAWAMCCLGIPAACALKNHYKWSDIEIKRRREETRRRRLDQMGERRKIGERRFLLREYFRATRRARGLLRAHKQPMKEQRLENFEISDESGSAADLESTWSSAEIDVEWRPELPAIMPETVNIAVQASAREEEDELYTDCAENYLHVNEFQSESEETVIYVKQI